MHSSRMRTAGLLTVSQHALGRWMYSRMHVCVSKHALGRRGVSLGVSAQGGVYPNMHYAGGVSQHTLGRGVSIQEGCLPL